MKSWMARTGAALLLLTMVACCQADYRAEIVAWEDYLTRDGSDFDPAKLPNFVATGHVRQTACAAAVKMVIYDWTGDNAYAVEAKDLLQAILDYSSGGGDASFFTPFPFTFAYNKLDQGGFLDAAFRTDAADYADDTFRGVTIDDHPDEIHNQHFARAAGLAYAAQTWPGSSHAVDWNAYTREFWERFLALEDVPENAPNYDQIAVHFMWLLGDLLGETSRLDTPAIHAMFERVRDQVAPSGKRPDYGDSGGATNDPDWPMTNEQWGYLVAALHRAANFFDDGALRWTAERMWQSGSTNEPLVSRYTSISALFYLSFADDWEDAALVATMPTTGSQLQTRRYQDRSAGPIYDAADKIVLCPGRASGNPYLLMDLFTPHGSHAHVNQQGSINHYEVDDIPLLTTLGYNVRNPEHSNLVLMRPAGEMFPHRAPLFQANHWYTSELPLANVKWNGVEGFIKYNRINLRVACVANTAIRVDNLRLTGPAGEILVDDFETLDGWGFGGTGSLVNYDKTQGDNCMQILFSSGGTYFNAKSYGLTSVDLSQYTHFKIDWKLSNNQETARPFIFRIEGVEETTMSDFHCHALQLGTQKNQVCVAANAAFEYGMVKFDDYFTHDTQLTRRMVMDANGVVIVRDDMLPGSSAAGRNVGPVWNLCSTQTPTKGTQWVDSSGGDKELMVYMTTAPDRTIGCQTVSLTNSRTNQRAAYAQETVVAATPVRFVTVLIPHEPSANATALAAGVSVVETGTGFVGQTKVTWDDAGATCRMMLDVLYENEQAAATAFGDWQGAMTINAYDHSPTLRTSGSFKCHAARAQLDYSLAGASTAIERISVADAELFEYDGQLLLESSQPCTAMLDYSSGHPAGQISAPSGATVKVYSVSAEHEITINDTSSTGTYDPATHTLSFVVGEELDCAYMRDNDLLLVGDITGPEGVADCRVDHYDLAVLALYWLTNNDPQKN